MPQVHDEVKIVGEYVVESLVIVRSNRGWWDRNPLTTRRLVQRHGLGSSCTRHVHYYHRAVAYWISPEHAYSNLEIAA